MRADKLGKLIKKLASGHYGELADRLREEWRRREERRIYNAGQSASDASRFDSIFTNGFLQLFVSHDKQVDFVAALRGHADDEFMPGFALRSKFREYVETVLPLERQRIIVAAEQILSDRFPVFSLGFISYGDPPRWNYDPIHKVTAPECFYGDIDYLDPSVVGDSKIVWEISRFQFVYDLGQAYLLTGDEKYPRKFFELVQDWRRKNRDYHGVNFCSALESAFRIHALVWGIWFFKDSPSLSNECAEDLYGLIYTCANFVRHHLSKYFSPNTHLFGEAYALLVAGILFSEFSDALLWQKLGHDTLLSELDRQFTVDGMHAELSTAYHGYAVEFLLSLMALCKQRKISLATHFHDRLKQGSDLLAALQRPDGVWPHIGDEDGGRLFFLSRVPASDFRPLLESCRSFLSPGRDVGLEQYVDSFWFTGTAEQGRARADRDDLSAADVMAESHSPLVKGNQGGCDSGVIVSRSPSGMYSAFQCGSFGYLDSPHSHADMLHIDISVGDYNFLVDPGTYVYTADLEKRNLYRSAKMHNGPTLAGLALENPRDPFGWLQRPDCRLDCYFRTGRSEFYRATYQVEVSRGALATLSRAVLFVSDQMLVLFDSVHSPVPVESLWSFVVPGEAKLEHNDIIARFESQRLFLMTFSLDSLGVSKYPKDTPVSDDYLSLRHGSCATYSTEPSAVCNALFLILPRGLRAQIPTPSGIRRLSGGSLTHFTEGATETFIVRGASDRPCDGLEWNAEILMLQITNGSPQRLIVIGGTHVTYNSRDLIRAKSRVNYADIIWEGQNAHIETVGKADLTVPFRQAYP